MNVQISGDEITGYVEIKASPKRVFHALAQQSEWWGSPDTYTVTRSELPLEVGADWISEGIGRDGKVFHVKGKVIEVDPPRTLSYTWNPSWEQDLPETTVTFRLEAIDGGTRLRVQHGSFAKFDEGAKEHYQGWVRVLGWLTAFCEG